MFPISDDNPTLRFPLVTVLTLIALALAWVFIQGAGFDEKTLAASVCNLGLVAGEITRQAPLGSYVDLGHGLRCVVDDEAINKLTPITSMFLHGGWMHLLGNGLFLWVFGNNVEDSMGRTRFVFFYLLCGLAAAAAQVFQNPASPVPMIGASGAISGVLGGYLVLYPKVPVNVLIPIFIFIQIVKLPAYLVLLIWIGMQLLNAWNNARTGMDSGVAVWAHIGGFAAGVVLIKYFEDDEIVKERLRRLKRR